MAPSSPVWTDLTLADVGERLRAWAVETVPFAQRELDAVPHARWRKYNPEEWHQFAQQLGMVPSTIPSPGGPESPAWLGTLRDTLDGEVARRILVENLPGLPKTAAGPLLQATGHPCGASMTYANRVLDRLWPPDPAFPTRVTGTRSAFLARWSRASGLLPAQMLVLTGWLGGGLSPAGHRAPGRPICGSTPRCGQCPIHAHCPSTVREVEEEIPVPQTALAPEPDPMPTKVRMTDLPLENRPRERLASGATLDHGELLAILIKSGTASHSALDLAREILARYPTLVDLYRATVEELARIHGLGRAKAATIRAAMELGHRISVEVAAGPHRLAEKMGEPRAFFDRYARRFDGMGAENCLVISLSAKLRVIGESLVSVGTIDSVLMHPREIFAEAVRCRAHRICVLHNHPSGDPSPSQADRQVTNRLVEVGNLLGIPLIDHIIVGHGVYFSFRENGLLPGVGA